MRYGIGELMLAGVFCAGSAAAQEVSPSVAEVVARYEAAEESELRAELLGELAALGGAEAPPEQRARVAGALASALEDDSHALRGRAVELLARSPERELALPALLASVRRHDLELKAFWKEQERLFPPQPKSEPFDFMDATPAERKEMGDALQRANEQIQAQLAHFQANMELLLLTPKYCAAFVAIRDDRSVDGLEILLDGRNFGPDSDAMHDALIGFGTSRSIALCAEAFAEHERGRKEFERELKERERERPRKVPDYWKGTKEKWAERERARIEKGAVAVREKLARRDAWTASLQERLARFAAAEGLVPPPSKLVPARDWRNWATRAGQQLPASYGAARPAAKREE